MMRKVVLGLGISLDGSIARTIPFDFLFMCPTRCIPVAPQTAVTEARKV
jgi:hypothetical protein